MALPSGVTTANLTFGSPASGFNGEGVSTSITVEPTISLTHIATGAPMLAFIISAEAAEGMPGQVTLPHTDQDGFQDANGNPFKNWAYKVTGTHKSGNKKAISFDKVIQLPQGQASPVDLDLIPRGNVIALPVQAEALRVTDVAGFTGSVTAEQLSTVVEGGGGTAPSDANIAPIIETAGDTRDAVDARAIAVGDTRYVPLSATAKSPDALVSGDIVRNASGVVTSASVIWPDGTPGTYTTLAIDPTGAVNSYRITYGSPVTKTFTQPTITRDSSGAATTIPAVVVS